MGYTSSDILVDYSYLGPQGNVAAAIVLPALAIFAVAARFWGRARAKLGFKSDDWLVLAALILYIGMAICVLIGVGQHALGYPTPKAPPGSPKNAFLTFTSPAQQLIGKLEQAVLWQQVLSLGLVKASVVMFYRRIFNPGKGKRWFRYSTIALLVLIVSWTIAFFWMLIFACGTHFSAKWTTVTNLIKYCHGSNTGQMSMAITDFVTDVFIIMLPVPIIWKLHMKTSRKVGVTAVFLLGALAVAASGLRMAMFIIVDVSFINPKQDGGWTVDLFIFWSVIESGLTILAACLPSLTFLGQKLGFIQATAMRSLRSVFSMQSLRSRGSTGSHGKDDTMRNDSTDSQARIHMERIQGENTVNSQISGNANGSSAQHHPSNGIAVATSVSQRENIV